MMGGIELVHIYHQLCIQEWTVQEPQYHSNPRQTGVHADSGGVGLTRKSNIASVRLRNQTEIWSKPTTWIGIFRLIMALMWPKHWNRAKFFRNYDRIYLLCNTKVGFHACVFHVFPAHSCLHTSRIQLSHDTADCYTLQSVCTLAGTAQEEVLCQVQRPLGGPSNKGSVQLKN